MTDRLLVLAVLIAAVVLVACGGDDSDDGATPSAVATIPERSPTELELPIKVAVTLPLFEDFVRQIGKENVEVFSLVPPNTDPHTYQLTEDDLERALEADFVFVNGLGIDDHLKAAIEKGQPERPFVIPFASNIRSPRGEALGNPELTAQEAGDNAHLWLDPSLAYVYAEIVADEFVIYDGVRHGFYTANFA
ncbi:MAG: metal ABC transporter substrate-binding protein, partial [Gammaproteobacteria bacterium]